MRTMPRRVSAENLDHLAASDPAARGSRQDLLRVHHAMGTRGIVAHGWRQLLPRPPLDTPLRILELGAGDGRLLLAVAQALSSSWPRVHLTLLDRLDLVHPTTVAAYARLGWTVNLQVADVLDWASTDTGPRWDLISTTLFLHHFEGEALARVLQAATRRSDRFFACEPRRAWPALAGSHLVGALGANAVTRNDAVLSVRAGFRSQELSELWTGPAALWRLEEGAAGLFSHRFSALRAGVG